MAKPDYSTWLTKAQAAEACGVSTKQIERWAADKLLQFAKWKRPEGGPAIVVYHPADVWKIAHERNPDAEAFVLPNASDDKPPSTAALAVRQPSAEQFLRTFAAAVAGMSPTSQTVRVPLAERLYLTIEEAAEFTGLSAAYLRRQIAAGKLTLMKGAGHRGADVLKRADLAQL